MSVAIQRFNSVLLHDTLTVDIPRLIAIQHSCFYPLFLTSGIFTIGGIKK